MLEAEEAVALRGVGRLNVAGTRFCTATLISETVIVTAAHCLFDPRTPCAGADRGVPLRRRAADRQDRGGPAGGARGDPSGLRLRGIASPAGVAPTWRCSSSPSRCRPRTRRRSRPRPRRARRAAGDRLLCPRPGAGALDRGALRPRRQLRRGGGARLRGGLRRLRGAGPPGRGRRTAGSSPLSRPWATALDRAGGHADGAGRPLDRAAARGAGRRTARGVTGTHCGMQKVRPSLRPLRDGGGCGISKVTSIPASSARRPR